MGHSNVNTIDLLLMSISVSDIKLSITVLVLLHPLKKKHDAHTGQYLKYQLSFFFLPSCLSDTSSRKEVLHLYPDPPTDAQSLDIQQQALLREQQRKIRLMKREEEDGQQTDAQTHRHLLRLLWFLINCCLSLQILWTRNRAIITM